MKTFETKAFTMTIHDDLLIEFSVKKHINLQASDVWESRDMSVNYMPGKKFFVLFEGDEDASVWEKLDVLEHLKNILNT